MREVAVTDYEAWRGAARALLSAGVPPGEVFWRGPGDGPSLFGAAEPGSGQQRPLVPARFAPLAATVACHRSPERWHLLYSALWRLTRGERHLLDLATDPLVERLASMERSVRRDTHKMHAFVRFRRVVAQGGESFVAWYRPDHDILRRAVPFFRGRFAAMRWAVLTPNGSAYWDGSCLDFGPGVPRSAAPDSDELERLWLAYYRAIFNPARLKLRAMKKELPVRFWDLLPEAGEIAGLNAGAPGRLERMLRDQGVDPTQARRNTSST